MKDDGADEPRGAPEFEVSSEGYGKWFEMCGRVHKKGGKFIRICEHCSYTNPAESKTCVLCEKRIGVTDG